MPEPTQDTAALWFGREAESLSAAEQSVLAAARQRAIISRDVEQGFAEQLSFGQRLADQVAVFGGSWSFIIVFAVILAAWVLLNTLLLVRPFDAYPFIFLNLILSMLAAIQAPVIMMSQNRQAARDRADAAHDYEINLKAEIEIMALHDKLDHLRTEQIEALLTKQQEQIALLTRLLQAAPPGPDAARGAPPQTLASPAAFIASPSDTSALAMCSPKPAASA
ncbi:DUF1003 domain-containing protein [Paeniroseomonas aquatica]|uniref:DUF1003 domain-containing protein n=1 Tax=Paeniroseomonas aquatica TaxID=373043 RepID=UPI003618674B